MPGKRRVRTWRLTDSGLEVLQRRLHDEWESLGSDSPLTWTVRAAYLEVSVNTAKKILERRGNDRCVLIHAFARLGLPWDEAYAEPLAPQPVGSVPPPSAGELEPESPSGVARRSPRPTLTRGLAPVAAVVGLFLILALEPSSTHSRHQDPPRPPDSLDARSSRADRLLRIARDAWARGDYRIARSFVTEALEVARKYGFGDAYADALRLKGDILAATGDLKGAVEQYKAALPLWATFARPHGWGTLLEVLGAAEARLGRLNEAERHLTQSLAVLERSGLHETAVGTIRGLGSLAAVRGDLALARRWYDRACAATTDDPDDPTRLDLEALRALLLRDEGCLDQALKTLEECRARWIRHGSLRWVATTDLQIGTVHAAAGDRDSARAAWERAKKGYEAVGDRKGAADCEAWLTGRLHLRSGPASRAEQFF